MKIELTINLDGDTRTARATLIRLLEDSLVFLRGQPCSPTLSSSPIADLKMSNRTTNCLLSAGIGTIGELILHRHNDLMRKPLVGRHTMIEITAALAERGLHLTQSEYKKGGCNQ